VGNAHPTLFFSFNLVGNAHPTLGFEGNLEFDAFCLNSYSTIQHCKRRDRAIC
jgi:hypothetical protein